MTQPTKETMLRIAEQAGLRIDRTSYVWEGIPDPQLRDYPHNEVYTLIELAMAEGARIEREECAKLCDEYVDSGLNHVAKSIRARKVTK